MPITENNLKMGRAGSAIPVVSVVMPVRDSQATVRTAIESIRNQSYADFELIVVDDGSVDGTPACLAELSAVDSRIKVLARHGMALSPL